MPGTADVDSPSRPYWFVPVARAVPALIVGVVITFLSDHSPIVGFLAFGGFAVATGAIIAVGSARALDRGVTRSFFIAQGVITVLSGIAALALSSAVLPVLVFILSTWATITGLIEVYAGVRDRRRTPLARDWIFVGALTVAVAILVLVLPPDFAQPYTGPDEVERVLTASVIIVGSFGAYAAIIGVYLVIAGLSLKWAPVTSNATEKRDAS